MDRACHFLRCFNRLSIECRRSCVIDLHNDLLFDMNVKEKSVYRDLLHNFLVSFCHVTFISVFNYSHINRVHLFHYDIPFEPVNRSFGFSCTFYTSSSFLLLLYGLYFTDLFYFNHKVKKTSENFFQKFQKFINIKFCFLRYYGTLILLLITIIRTRRYL